MSNRGPSSNRSRTEQLGVKKCSTKREYSCLIEDTLAAEVGQNSWGQEMFNQEEYSCIIEDTLVAEGRQNS